MDSEQIVRMLAEEDPPIGPDLWCLFCRADVGRLDPPQSHEQTCPWRLAREWVAANPG
jgi:hypothetical protein